MGRRKHLYISVCIMVCIYDAGFTQMKRSNACEMCLRAVLEMLFIAIHSFTHTQRHAEHAGFIFDRLL